VAGSIVGPARVPTRKTSQRTLSPAAGMKATPKRSKTRRTPARTAESRHPRKLPKSRAEAAAIERLRRICMALPEVIEKIAWGELTWRAGKIFAQMDTHHHGAEHVAVWLPARPGVQEALVDEDPVHYFRPPYVGHKGWVGARIDNRPDWRAVAALVAEAYREVASTSQVAILDARRSKPKRGWRTSWSVIRERPPRGARTGRRRRARTGPFRGAPPRRRPFAGTDFSGAPRLHPRERRARRRPVPGSSSRAP